MKGKVDRKMGDVLGFSAPGAQGSTVDSKKLGVTSLR